MAAHESPRTTKLYDRTTDEVTLDEVERIYVAVSVTKGFNDPESSAAKSMATPSFSFTFVAASFTALRFLKSALVIKFLVLLTETEFITTVHTP